VVRVRRGPEPTRVPVVQYHGVFYPTQKNQASEYGPLELFDHRHHMEKPSSKEMVGRGEEVVNSAAQGTERSLPK